MTTTAFVRSANSDAVAGRTRVLFGLAIIGAILLPLLPIWTAAYSVVAFVWLVQTTPSGHARTVFTVASVALAALYLFGWLSELVTSPLTLLLNGFLFVYGVPVGALPSAAALLLQLLFVAMLAWQLWLGAQRIERLFILAATGFGGWVALSTLVALSTGLAVQADASLIAAAVWINWPCVALLVLALVRSQSDLQELLQVFVIGGAILALGMLTQMLLGDFSYVLVSPDPGSFFERVRGSYYYHAPPAQMLAVIAPLGFTLMQGRNAKSIVGALATLAIVSVVLLNSTRGVSFAMLGGMGLLTIFLFAKLRHIQLALLSTIALCLVFSQIYYVKPGTPVVDPLPVEMQPELGLPVPDIGPLSSFPADATAGPEAEPQFIPAPEASAPANVEEFAASNGMRLGLAEAGLRSMTSNPLLGSGAGNAQILLPGQTEFETSSHVLAVDMGVMTGMPGLALFLATLAIPGIGLVVSAVLDRRNSGYLYRIALSASLGTYAFSSLFHPQERSEVIALAFLLAGLGLAALAIRSSVEAEPVMAAIGIRKRVGTFVVGSGVLALGFVGWMIITSPSYVFPAIEFLARYRSILVAHGTPVVTNSPVLGGVIQAGMRVAGIPSDVKLMADASEELLVDDAFIVWSPSQEKFYPTIRRAAGMAQNARYGQWMGINILPNWWLLDSFQPNVQFLKAGTYPEGPITPRGLEDVAVIAGRDIALAMDEPVLAGAAADVVVQGDPSSIVTLRVGTTQTPIAYNVPTTVELPKQANEQVEFFDATGDGTLHVEAYPFLMPSVAQYMPASAWIGSVRQSDADAAKLVDLVEGKGFWWDARVETIIEFRGGLNGLAAYRFKPMYDGTERYNLPLSWTVEAYSQGKWVRIGERLLTEQPSGQPAFLVETQMPSLAIRFVFKPAIGAVSRFGLSEVELFPTPKTTEE